eukprot:g1045.t1
MSGSSSLRGLRLALEAVIRSSLDRDTRARKNLGSDTTETPSQQSFSFRYISQISCNIRQYEYTEGILFQSEKQLRKCTREVSNAMKRVTFAESTSAPKVKPSSPFKKHAKSANTDYGGGPSPKDLFDSSFLYGPASSCLLQQAQRVVSAPVESSFTKRWEDELETQYYAAFAEDAVYFVDAELVGHVGLLLEAEQKKMKMAKEDEFILDSSLFEEGSFVSRLIHDFRERREIQSIMEALKLEIELERQSEGGRGSTGGKSPSRSRPTNEEESSDDDSYSDSDSDSEMAAIKARNASKERRRVNAEMRRRSYFKKMRRSNPIGTDGDHFLDAFPGEAERIRTFYRIPYNRFASVNICDPNVDSQLFCFSLISGRQSLGETQDIDVESDSDELENDDLWGFESSEVASTKNDKTNLEESGSENSSMDKAQQQQQQTQRNKKTKHYPDIAQNSLPASFELYCRSGDRNKLLSHFETAWQTNEMFQSSNIKILKRIEDDYTLCERWRRVWLAVYLQCIRHDIKKATELAQASQGGGLAGKLTGVVSGIKEATKSAVRRGSTNIMIGDRENNVMTLRNIEGKNTLEMGTNGDVTSTPSGMTGGTSSATKLSLLSPEARQLYMSYSEMIEKMFVILDENRTRIHTMAEQAAQAAAAKVIASESGSYTGYFLSSSRVDPSNYSPAAHLAAIIARETVQTEEQKILDAKLHGYLANIPAPLSFQKILASRQTLLQTRAHYRSYVLNNHIFACHRKFVPSTKTSNLWISTKKLAPNEQWWRREHFRLWVLPERPISLASRVWSIQYSGTHPIDSIAKEILKQLDYFVEDYVVLEPPSVGSKQCNVADDPACWTSWVITVRTKQLKSKYRDSVEANSYAQRDISIVVTRRKYLPPYMDRQQDFLCVHCGRFDTYAPDSAIGQIGRTANDILNSITPYGNTTNPDYTAVEANVHTLLLDADSYSWFETRLKVRPPPRIMLRVRQICFCILNLLRNTKTWDSTTTGHLSGHSHRSHDYRTASSFNHGQTYHGGGGERNISGTMSFRQEHSSNTTTTSTKSGGKKASKKRGGKNTRKPQVVCEPSRALRHNLDDFEKCVYQNGVSQPQPANDPFYFANLLIKEACPMHFIFDDTTLNSIDIGEDPAAHKAAGSPRRRASMSNTEHRSGSPPPSNNNNNNNNTEAIYEKNERRKEHSQLCALTWRRQVWHFLAYMIDGGLLGTNLNFETIVSNLKHLTFDTQMKLCQILEACLFFEAPNLPVKIQIELQSFPLFKLAWQSDIMLYLEMNERVVVRLLELECDIDQNLFQYLLSPEFRKQWYSQANENEQQSFVSNNTGNSLMETKQGSTTKSFGKSSILQKLLKSPQKSKQNSGGNGIVLRHDQMPEEDMFKSQDRAYFFFLRYVTRHSNSQTPDIRPTGTTKLSGIKQVASVGWMVSKMLGTISKERVTQKTSSPISNVISPKKLPLVIRLCREYYKLSLRENVHETAQILVPHLVELLRVQNEQICTLVMATLINVCRKEDFHQASPDRTRSSSEELTSSLIELIVSSGGSLQRIIGFMASKNEDLVRHASTFIFNLIRIEQYRDVVFECGVLELVMQLIKPKFIIYKYTALGEHGEIKRCCVGADMKHEIDSLNRVDGGSNQFETLASSAEDYQGGSATGTPRSRGVRSNSAGGVRGRQVAPRWSEDQKSGANPEYTYPRTEILITGLGIICQLTLSKDCVRHLLYPKFSLLETIDEMMKNLCGKGYDWSEIRKGSVQKVLIRILLILKNVFIQIQSSGNTQLRTETRNLIFMKYAPHSMLHKILMSDEYENAHLLEVAAELFYVLACGPENKNYRTSAITNVPRLVTDLWRLFRRCKSQRSKENVGALLALLKDDEKSEDDTKAKGNKSSLGKFFKK